jgi:hypothetical protein
MISTVIGGGRHRDHEEFHWAVYEKKISSANGDLMSAFTMVYEHVQYADPREFAELFCVWYKEHYVDDLAWLSIVKNSMCYMVRTARSRNAIPNCVSGNTRYERIFGSTRGLSGSDYIWLRIYLAVALGCSSTCVWAIAHASPGIV